MLSVNKYRMIINKYFNFAFILVVCPIIVNLTGRIDVGRDEFIYGVTKLRNEIYVLCRTVSAETHVIRVFEDRNPFLHRQKIEIKEIEFPWDIGSSDKENCLYVSDSDKECFWKITRVTDDDHRIITRLRIYDAPFALSVTRDGRLLVVNSRASILMIYGSDAKNVQSIRLPKDIDNPRHAVETSIGNFIIIHERMEEGNTRSRGRARNALWAVSELTRDGEVVMRSFPSSSKKQTLRNPQYLLLDSDDQAYVADYENSRVILLGSDLRWKQILCPAKEEETRIRRPQRLCYDEDKKQLIVGGDSHSGSGDGVHIYTFSRI